ncbi:hypothetical protein GNI_080690 [Gregarina niphandrodes]|uniref:Uncharacterized protein n=1 Tax=Gregarina niphandrodes TaxID=110365 RepID=A0A023B6C7_GRENI|nr:hypothetical protein GNI_080690 [Gregarina niphandrodes]EZG66406.1 hypothetical protein GNI_080690 [Gregarina niphandrodes]|eukprot:XP_011133998.1 hypothetical protein GNI_080690 [Gregarina niphandrodes]
MSSTDGSPTHSGGAQSIGVQSGGAHTDSADEGSSDPEHPLNVDSGRPYDGGDIAAGESPAKLCARSSGRALQNSIRVDEPDASVEKGTKSLDNAASIPGGAATPGDATTTSDAATTTGDPAAGNVVTPGNRAITRADASTPDNAVTTPGDTVTAPGNLATSGSIAIPSDLPALADVAGGENALVSGAEDRVPRRKDSEGGSAWKGVFARFKKNRKGKSKSAKPDARGASPRMLKNPSLVPKTDDAGGLRVAASPPSEFLRSGAGDSVEELVAFPGDSVTVPAAAVPVWEPAEGSRSGADLTSCGAKHDTPITDSAPVDLSEAGADQAVCDVPISSAADESLGDGRVEPVEGSMACAELPKPPECGIPTTDDAPTAITFLDHPAKDPDTSSVGSPVRDGEIVYTSVEHTDLPGADLPTPTKHDALTTNDHLTISPIQKRGGSGVVKLGGEGEVVKPAEMQRKSAEGSVPGGDVSNPDATGAPLIPSSIATPDGKGYPPADEGSIHKPADEGSLHKPADEGSLHKDAVEEPSADGNDAVCNVPSGSVDMRTTEADQDAYWPTRDPIVHASSVGAPDRDGEAERKLVEYSIPPTGLSLPVEQITPTKDEIPTAGTTQKAAREGSLQDETVAGPTADGAPLLSHPVQPFDGEGSLNEETVDRPAADDAPLVSYPVCRQPSRSELPTFLTPMAWSRFVRNQT